MSLGLKPNKKDFRKSLTFFDFCAGIGGGRLGLELNGLKCLGFSEIDRTAIKTYKEFFSTKDELEIGDLTKINPYDLPDFDLLISGFPCQSFSIVGKRKGFADIKGQIIFYLIEILKIKQPLFFILENVKGFVNHNQGQTLKKTLQILQNCGYELSFKVLNSLDFSLPQSRERVYFIGIRKDLNKNFDFSLLQTKRINLLDFLNPNENNKFSKNSQSYQTFLKFLENKYNKNRINLNKLLEKNFLVIDTRQSDLRIYENKIPTLRRDRQGILYVYERELYKLSALEALKLQGFGKILNLKDKIKNLKESDILKQCGNAMSVNVIENICKNLKEQMSG